MMRLPTDKGIPKWMTLKEAAAHMGFVGKTGRPNPRRLERFLKRREKELGRKLLTNMGEGEKLPFWGVTVHALFAAADEGFPSVEELYYEVEELKERVDEHETAITKLVAHAKRAA